MNRLPTPPERNPKFIVRCVRLSGRASLLGAEQVTWKFSDDGLCVVVGGNGCGKTLLCSAIMAAAMPEQSEVMRGQLFSAGLSSATIIGQLGGAHLEWSLNFETGEISYQDNGSASGSTRHTPVLELISSQKVNPAALPHFVLNGAWKRVEQGQLDWAAGMITAPLQKEIEGWQSRIESLSGEDGQARQLNLHSDIARIDQQLANSKALREELRLAQARGEELQEQITDAELAADISSEEQKAITSKIDLAERCLHLENWASELKSSWDSAESARTHFANLQERLETLQNLTRGLGENAEQLTRDYLALSAERASIAEKIRSNEGTSAELHEKIDRLRSELARLDSEETSATTAVQPLTTRLEETERELKELSRTRIDLLRQREGLERQRADKYGELAALGPDEWLALDRFLENGAESDGAAKADSAKQSAELARLNARIAKEFDGFESLSVDTPLRIEKLYALIENISAREAELALLRSKVVELQTAASGTGPKVVLSILGAVAAGIPSGMALGWDVGFFGAVVGGGLGYAVAKFISPGHAEDAEDYVRKIETLQHLQQSSLSEREALRRTLEMFATFPDAETALARWQEYVRLTGRKSSLEEIVKADTRPAADDKVPAVLRKLEREDIRRRVAEYRTLSNQLSSAVAALASFEQENGAHARMTELETQSQRLREEIESIEKQGDASGRERQKRRQELASEIARLESEISLLPSVESAHAQLRDILVKMESLDESVGGVFSHLGADEILSALRERGTLQNELRDAKAKLSGERSSQELSLRTGMIEDELRQVTARIQEMDPLFATLASRQEGLTKYKEQLEDLVKRRQESLALADRLSAEVRRLDLPTLQVRVSELPDEEQLLFKRVTAQSRIDEVEKSVQTAQRVCEELSVELSEVRDRAPTNVMSIIQTVIFESIGERFAAAEWSGTEWIMHLEDGQRRAISSLSRGISELVTLCLNSGLLFASSEAELAPVFWDDVLSQLDNHHLEIARQLIDRIAAKRQVVLFTRDSRIQSWGKSVEVLAGRHDSNMIAQ